MPSSLARAGLEDLAIPHYRCEICGLSTTACTQVEKMGPAIFGGGSIWIPGKDLIFLAGGSRNHWAHPEHYGLIGKTKVAMVRQVAEFFDYPGGWQALVALVPD